jgi:hypothetical protein
LEKEAIPLRQQLEELRAAIDLLRTELRRRSRQAELAGRRETRRELAEGGVPTLEEVVAQEVEFDLAADLDNLRFLRESATEVRLGYAAAATQGIAFTDGRETDEVRDLGAAHAAWARGWDFGTPLARGVRVYPVGSRAERVVPASELRVERR